jgi:hypothetical protein
VESWMAVENGGKIAKKYEEDLCLNIAHSNIFEGL